jgi:ABC-type amino acid transport system permease subunit
VETQLVREQPADQVYTSTRARIVALLGPLTAVAGVIWAIVQPSRLTLLHPYHQGFWWLVIEAPILVVFAGVAFAVFVARPLVAELEGDDGAA